MLPDEAMICASSAKTAKGAISMIRSTIFRITSLRPSMSLFSGFTFFGSISSMEMPKAMAKKITCSIRLLLPNAAKMLSGTISTRKERGPFSCCVASCMLEVIDSSWA